MFQTFKEFHDKCSELLYIQIIIRSKLTVNAIQNVNNKQCETSLRKIHVRIESLLRINFELIFSLALLIIYLYIYI